MSKKKSSKNNTANNKIDSSKPNPQKPDVSNNKNNPSKGNPSKDNHLIGKNLFYSVLKNEDAEPYVGDNIIIVADGLGGAGSTVHDITFKKYGVIKKNLLESAFSDIVIENEESEKIKNQLNEWIKPICEKGSHTSALWASRIAIARCAYALECNPDFIDCDLSDEKVRGKLVGYISKGLKETVKTFNLQKGKFDNQVLLPTTLAFMKYSTDETNKTTTVEVLWAGDSRCYVLTVDGLKQLTIDDEDNSGAVTNLFLADDKIKSRLNYRKYTIQNPCVLIGVSDGIFDPFDPHDGFGVEKTILEQIKKSQSYPALMKNLHEFYGKVHADDSTMAFVPIGFVDFKDLKNQLIGRTEKVLKLWNTFVDFSSIMEVKSRSEEEIVSYVKTRTSDKFDSIMSLLFENYLSNTQNWIYTKPIREVIGENLGDGIDESLDLLLEKIKNEDKSKRSKIFKDNPQIKNEDLRNNIEAVSRILKGISQIKEPATIDFSNTVKEYKENIYEKEDVCWEAFRDENKDWKERSQSANVLNSWMNLELCLEKGSTEFVPIVPVGLDSDDKNLFETIKGFINKNTKSFKALNLPKLHNEYERKVTQIFDELKRKHKLCKTILVDGIINLQPSKPPVYDRSKLSGQQKQELIEEIVKALAKNYNKNSLIDSFYNGTRLNLFKAYYKMKANPDSSIDNFERDLEELESGYVDFIRKTN